MPLFPEGFEENFDCENTDVNKNKLFALFVT